MIYDVKRKDVVHFLEPRRPAKVPEAAFWGDSKPPTSLYRVSEIGFLCLATKRASELLMIILRWQEDD